MFPATVPLLKSSRDPSASVGMTGWEEPAKVPDRVPEELGAGRGRYMGGKKWLSGGFGAEDAMEARAGELHADEALALCGRLDDVDYAPGCGKVGFGAARSVVRKRNADFQVGADGNVKPRNERGAAAA